MKFIFALISVVLWFSLVSNVPPASSLQGAWSSQTTINGEPMTQVLLFSDGYFASAMYNSEDGAFFHTNGGSFKVEGDKLSLIFEFDSADSAKVGTTEFSKITKSKEGLHLVSANGKQFKGKSLDDNTTTDLTGAWLMGGRKQDGKITRRDTTTPRKTMKILTGNCFQWIAYNTETKQFSGTGGGTYTATDSTYVEKIEFFLGIINGLGRNFHSNMR